MKTIVRVFAYLGRYPGLALATLFCAAAGTLTVIVFPRVTQQVINEVLIPHRPERLWPLIWIALGAFLAQNVFNGLRIILNNTFEQRVIFDLRSDLYSHMQRLPLRWFDNRATGDLMTRVLEDVTSVERMLIDGVETGVVALLQVVIVTVVLFRLNATARLAFPGASAAARGRRAGLYAHRAPALPAPAHRLLGHEFAAARQPGRHPPDQDLRARERGACALQPHQRAAAHGHADRDANLGALHALHGLLRGLRHHPGGGVRRERGAGRPARSRADTSSSCCWRSSSTIPSPSCTSSTSSSNPAAPRAIASSRSWTRSRSPASRRRRIAD